MGDEKPKQGLDMKGQRVCRESGNPGWLWSSGTERHWVGDKAER